MDRITIVGTGLIGTSLGLAIKQAKTSGIEIVGVDIDRGNASKAQKKGALDKAEGNLANAVKDAEIVIIATPVMEIKTVMEIIGSRLREGCLVTDTGGSKAIVLEWAEQYLPDTVNFVGGHPMAGKEASGPDAADGTMFQNRPYCVIPSRRATQDAVSTLTDMIRAIGAKPYFIGLDEHDSFVAAVSHLPLLLSVALVGCTSKSPSWGDIAQVASTGYKDATRLASGDPIMHRDIFHSNNESLVYWIDAFAEELYKIRQMLVDESDGRLKELELVFNEAQDARNRWLAGVIKPGYRSAEAREQMPKTTDSMTHLVFGDPEARRRLFGWGDFDRKGSKNK